MFVYVISFLYLYLVLSLTTVEVEGKGMYVVEEDKYLLKAFSFLPNEKFWPHASLSQ